METVLINTATLPKKYYLILKYEGSNIPAVVGCSDSLVGAQMWLNSLCQFSRDVVLGTVSPKYGVMRDTVFMHKGQIILKAYQDTEFTVHGLTFRIRKVGDMKEHMLCLLLTGTILDLWLCAHVI